MSLEGLTGDVLTILEYIFRLFLSGVLGGLIGYERQSRSKAAGIRTNILVSVTSCLIMITSVRLALDLQNKEAYSDAARIVAQVVSGVGFLGAGAILKNNNKIKGLTTAASLWAVAGIGIAIGRGYYFISLFATIIIFITLNFNKHS